MGKQRTVKKRGEATLRRFLIAATVLLFAILIAGLSLHGGRIQKQAPVPPIVTEVNKKEDPATRQAVAEKISGYARPEALISVYELNMKFNNPNTVILDTRSRSYRVFQTSYLVSHLPGALPILHERYCRPAYPDQLAPPLQLQNVLGELGINNDSTIVFYGNDGLQARLYWAIKMYGYDNIKVLDGGFEKWQEVGYDLTTANCARPPEEFEFDFSKSKTQQMLASTDEVEAAVGNPGCIIIDARTKDEYLYKHIPGSVNICAAELLQSDKTFKIAIDLKALFDGNKITQDKKVIVYSDAAVRSSLVWFALSELLGYPNVKNYDASFNEWQKLERRVDSGG